MRSRVTNRRQYRRSATPFVLFHFVPLLALLTGVTKTALVLLVGLYVLRMLAITCGYHRYFSHRTYKMNRAMQFVVGFIGTTAAQRGPIWWAKYHRDHHKYADTDRDPHTPKDGFWWSHIGWVLSGDFHDCDYRGMEDLTKYPELVFINKHDWIGPWVLGILCTVVGGWSGLVLGFFGSTIGVWHATFSINSLTHLVGRRRYATPDTSRNSFALALVTMGEGWHNNHHHYPRSVRQGFFWWEVDAGYMLLKVMSWLHVVHDMQYPTPASMQARLIRTGQFDVGRFRQHFDRAVHILPEEATHVRELLREAADQAATMASTSTRRSRVQT